MTKYNTGNPVGSNSPLDLYDNAENLDAGINGNAPTWRDRLGKTRKSMAGIETDFEQFLADGSTIEFPTWAAASAAAGAGQIPLNRQVAVIGDAGTHLDPVSGLTVPNSGRFLRVAAGLQFRSADVLSQKLDIASVPEVQDETRQSVGIVKTSSGVGSGSVEVIADADGVMRIVSIYPEGDDDPAFNGETPNAWRAPAFGMDSNVTAWLDSDPDRTEMILDAGGELRVLQAFGARISGPVIFGASGEVAPTPVSAPTEFVMFLVAGQSNAQGWGQRTLSPRIPDGCAYQYYNGNLTAISTDSVGNANSGSAWPSFAIEFHRRTGLGVIFVPAAVGNSGLTAKASRGSAGGSGESQSWSPTGELRVLAAERVLAAQLAATAAGLAWRFGGILWSQGERDSRCLPTSTSNPSLITEQEYLDTFDGLIAYFNDQFGDSKWPWIMSMTGGDAEGIDAAGLESMRALQRQITRTRPQVRFGWTGAYNLIARGLMRSHDFPNDTPGNNRSHYAQQGYNEMGAAMATVAATVSI